ncbi:protein FAM184B isoform X2 [Xenopus laevis]|uniref:Protein FAM184B isoform X2 n=1 Tax=Xenopus laevis TaxID=8355 RepID=A0A8J1MRP4_XENLA|nr:protein FAM184B isoform X2 [Xenopus laevis]
MSSGKNHQHSQYNGTKGQQMLFSQAYTHELHGKMCKKIAQLTKVIYALNLKVDEYEYNILALKEAHQDELDLISNETKEKFLHYESKIGEEQRLHQRIQNLEESLEKNNMIKEQTLAEFTKYKRQMEEWEMKTKSEHSERISVISKEMLSMKSDFETKIKQLTDEADSLKKECKVSERDKAMETLNEKLNAEVQTLSQEVENLKSHNQKLVEEHDLKISKLHTSYSKERENLRKALQQSVTEMIKQLQQKEQEQKRCSQAKEAAMEQELKQQKDEIRIKEQELKDMTKHLQKIKERMQDVEVQLQQRDQEVMESKSKQSQAEDEVSVAKDRLLQQENAIHSHIEQMKMMASAQTAAANEIAELKRQLVQLQQQKTPTKTGACRKEHSDSFSSKQPLKEYAAQKQEIMRQHREEIGRIKRQKDEEKKHLKEQLVKSLEDLAKNHATEIKAMKTERIRMQKEQQTQLEEMKKKYEQQINQLVEERETLCAKHQHVTFQDQPELCSSLSLNDEIKDSIKPPSEVLNTEQTQCVCICHSTTEDHQANMLPVQQKKLAKDPPKSALEEEEQSQNQIKKLNKELHKCEKEMSGLEKENSILRDSVEQLSKEIMMSKQELLGLQEKQSRTNEELKLKQKSELDKIMQNHRQEIQTIVSKFSTTQTFLQSKIISLEAELKEAEDKAHKLPRPEDLHLINRLQDRLSDKDQVIKELMEIQKYDQMEEMETHRSQSFSCNPREAGSLTPTLKKKKISEVPTRVTSVPNLADYEKSFSEISSKKGINPMRSSQSLDQSVKPGYPFKHPSLLLDVIRPNRRNPGGVPAKRETKEQESKRPEWLAKYFSF